MKRKLDASYDHGSILPYRAQVSTQSDKKRRTASRGATSISPSPNPGPSFSSLVDSKHYRKNLYCCNGIKLRNRNWELPGSVQSLVDMLDIERAVLAPTHADWQQLKVITDSEEGYFRPLETLIRPLFDDMIFPRAYNAADLMRVDSLVMKKSVVPTRFLPKEQLSFSGEEKQAAKISIPVPDIIFGYPLGAFSNYIQRLLPRILGRFEAANAASLILPFLVVEFKGDGGSMWACTNQCLGGAATCVNMGNYLNIELGRRDLILFNNTTFSIALNGGYASLYVAWKPIMELDQEQGPNAEFYMQQIRGFSLLDMEDFMKFRRCVGDIIDWGKRKRLQEISGLIEQIGAEMRHHDHVSS
ncbi:hypothetical protein PWT90_05635 [Aphanocladium album]|nr:hypothetical protein PWT90_05635 [Aphanocladium album]